MPSVLTTAIEECDPSMRGHAARVTRLAVGVALQLRWSELQLAALRMGGALHDVGKLAVDPAVLQKPGPLDDAELAEIRRHPVTGARLIQPVARARPALPYVLFHHERWEGGGYPTGRRAEEIPLQARLLAVADAFDAMTSERPYREPLSYEEALAEVERCAGSQFDPELASAFLAVWGRRDKAAVGA